MRPKYIDERLPDYFIFGETRDGKVDINNGYGDICTVTKEEAEKLIKDRSEVLKLIHLFNEKYPTEFKDCFDNL